MSACAPFLVSALLVAPAQADRAAFCEAFIPVIEAGVIDGRAEGPIPAGSARALDLLPPSTAFDRRMVLGAYLTGYGQGMTFAEPGEIIAEFMLGCLNA